MPVRAAELKVRETDAPQLDDSEYAIAVYGLPARYTTGDAGATDQLKKQATLKREGQKDVKPSSVEIMQREDGPVIIYLFPKTKEIVAGDKRVTFDAHIGRLKLDQPFYLDDMMFQGKLQL
jgi:hypothetical protein